MALAGIAHGAIPATLVAFDLPSRRLRAIHSCCPAAWPSACWSRRPLASALPSSLRRSRPRAGCRPGFAGDRSLEAARGRGAVPSRHHPRPTRRRGARWRSRDHPRGTDPRTGAERDHPEPAGHGIYPRLARRRPAQLAALPSMLRHGSAGALRHDLVFGWPDQAPLFRGLDLHLPKRRRAGRSRARAEAARARSATSCSVSGGRTRAASNGGARTSSRTRQSSARSARDTRSCTRSDQGLRAASWRSDGSCIPRGDQAGAQGRTRPAAAS